MKPLLGERALTWAPASYPGDDKNTSWIVLVTRKPVLAFLGFNFRVPFLGFKFYILQKEREHFLKKNQSNRRSIPKSYQDLESGPSFYKTEKINQCFK